MTIDIEQVRRELAELGARIAEKTKEYHEQGALHGRDRVEAANFKIQHERAAARAASGHVSATDAIADELSTEVRILKDTFERWLARIDKESEKQN